MTYGLIVLVLCLLQSYVSSLLAKRFKLDRFCTFYATLLAVLIASYAWLGPAIMAGDVLYGIAVGIASFVVIGIPVFLYDNKKSRPIQKPKSVGKEIVKDLLIVSPVEELVFRGVLFSLLLPLGLIAAAIIQAAVFAIWHLKFDKKFLLSVFTMALVFAFLYVVTGSILAPIVLHSLLNMGEYTLRPYMKRHL